MAYNTKPIVTDKDGNPISQYYNPTTDSYEPVEGSGGGNKVVLYNADGTENNELSLITILDKLSQLTGTVIDEETRKSNELQRIALYNQISQMLADGELKGDKGDIGLGLEFDWQGTSLGVKVDGDTDFVYVDLRGPQGEQGPSGTIENLDKTHIEDALGYVPADEDIIGQLANLTTDEKANLVQAINEVKSQSNQISTDVDKIEPFYQSWGSTGKKIFKLFERTMNTGANIHYVASIRGTNNTVNPTNNCNDIEIIALTRANLPMRVEVLQKFDFPLSVNSKFKIYKYSNGFNHQLFVEVDSSYSHIMIDGRELYSYAYLDIPIEEVTEIPVGAELVEWKQLATTDKGNWVQASLQNGWTGSLSYRKNDLGIVEVRGYIKAGTVTGLTTIATLPAEYAPSYSMAVMALRDTMADEGERLNIKTDGIIRTLNNTTYSTSVNYYIYTMYVAG